MRKNTNKITKILLLSLVSAAMLAGCGGASANDSYNVKNEMAMDMEADSAPGESADTLLNYDSSSDTDASQAVTDNRKIIEKIYFNVETKEFDSLVEELTVEVKNAGGYIESSTVSGNSYRYDGNRYADLVVRIPADKSNSFSKFVLENSTVTNRTIETDDVTLSYVDIESRVTALKTEKESLERLLEAAETLEDIIVIQDRLTEVIYEIESYQSQLRTYDNLIEYTTITINISEVEKVTILEEQTVWEEIGTNLKDNFSDVGQGFVDLFVYIVSNIPYILVIAVIAAAAVIIVKKLPKKVREKKRWKKEKTFENQDK